MSSASLPSYAPPFSPDLRRAAFAAPLIALLCVLAALYLPKALGIAIVLMVLAFFIDRPYPLLLLMVFLIPFNFVFEIGPIPIAAELLKVFVWIPFLIAPAARGRRFISSRHNLWFAIIAGLIVLSLIRSQDLPFSVKECVRLGSNVGLCYIVINLVDSREKLLQIFRVLAASTFLVACYGFYQFMIQGYGPLFWIVNPRIDTSFAHGRFTFWPWRGRMISVLTSEMELGHYFNLCLPVAVVLWLTEGKRHLSSKWFLVILTMLAGLLLTFTFSAWGALVAATCGLILLLDRKRRWKLIFTAALTFTISAVMLFYGPFRPFVESKMFGNSVGSFEWDLFTRFDSWLFAVKTWWSHPLIGVGIGNYQILEYAHELVHSPWGPSGSSPHETYLYLLAEMGLIGLICMLVILLKTIWTNIRLRKDPQLGLIALALAFALVTNMIGWFGDDSTFFGPHASYLVWLMVGLSEAVRNLFRRENRAFSPTTV
jgi:O-antigen ligase